MLQAGLLMLIVVHADGRLVFIEHGDDSFQKFRIGIGLFVHPFGFLTQLYQLILSRFHIC